MSKQVPWNAVILAEFERLACLTDEEKDVLETRVKGWSIIKQALKLDMSKSKVEYITKRLKQKYDLVQPYSDILPKRKLSAKETYS